MNCTNCGCETSNPKFCSRTCAATYTNRVSPKRPKEGCCKDCGIAVITKRCRCDQCRAKHDPTQINRNRTIGEFRAKVALKGKHPSWMHAYVRGMCRTWNRSLSMKPCAHCSYSKHVELAHIKALNEFPDETLLSEVNDPSNVIQLCPNCHWEFDHELLTLDEIKTAEMNRMIARPLRVELSQRI